MKTLNLKTSIYLAFLLIALLLGLIQIVGWIGASNQHRQRLISQQMESSYSDVMQISLDVQRMRQKVDRFVASGHESIPAEVQEITERIIQKIEQAENQTDIAKIFDLFEHIERHVEAFANHFKVVVFERSKRQELVDDRIPELSRAINENLDLLGDFSETQSRLTLSFIKSQFFKAEKSLLKYFEQPSSLLIDDLVEAIGEAIAQLEELELEPKARKELTASFREFESIGILAIQATRSYLYYCNVVMAGEQSEVSYYSKKLTEITTRRRQEIRNSVDAANANIVKATTSITLVAIILSVLVSGWVVYRVLPPIERLTDSFSQLTSGVSLDEIPGQDRDDEIGRMAKAAKVFSDQNQKTKELLEESEELSMELAKKTETLAAKNEELDSFAYVASHDLKSPLRGIRQLASWIEEDSKESLPNESAVHLQKLQTRVTRMENLLEDLLHFSRVGREQAEIEEVDLNELMTSVTDLTDNPSGVKVWWAGDLPVVATQATPLQQVIMNLVGNAVKHNDKAADGNVQIEATVVDKQLVVSIRDNGPGIAPDNHERVFQMYQRVGDPNVAGNGMGLAIVKKQVQSVGGEIHLESAPGYGTTFTFTWPLGPSCTPRSRLTEDLADGR